MARAAGILTSRGGLASHAAVVARGWGIPAVVGAAGIEVRAGQVVVGDRTLVDGTVITIDGSSGEVFEGTIPGTTEIVPEARTLLGWAHELGVPVGDAAAAEPSGFEPAARQATPDQCLRTVAIKGLAPIQAVADALLSSPDDIQPILDQLVSDGALTTAAGAYRLTESGTTRANVVLEAERSAWGTDAAGTALDAFVDLDQRVKTTVTAWQLRDDADGQVLNDHADADYDRAVLERLAAVHDDTIAWLGPLEAGCARLADYGARLGRALEQARAGDQRYVASPRVDSYHGIWFELHEDLIQLAGRNRADEVAAGRA
jgi:pyruvate,orthophosphate dikinase